MLALIFLSHPTIYLCSLLISQKILDINERGKYLYWLAIPLQYIVSILLLIGAAILDKNVFYSGDEMVQITAITVVPAVNLIILFIIDAISSQETYSPEVNIRREECKLLKEVKRKQSDLPAYYDGE